MGGGELFVLALRRAGRLVGLVPSAIFQEGARSARKFALLGNGVSDYLDALFEPKEKSTGAAQALRFLHGLPARWDLCEFSQLRPESALFDALLPLSCNAGIVLHEPCPVLSFAGAPRRLEAVIPARQAANVKYYRSRAARLGSLRCESADKNNLDALLADLFRLHDRRWQRSGHRGVLDAPPVQNFHREVASAMLDAGMLRLHRLLVDGRAIAVYYGFTHRCRAYYYLGGFDPDFSALSPGTLVIAHAIEQALAEGVESFDFLRGRERYKYLWGAVDTLTYRRSFAPEPRSAPATQSSTVAQSGL